MYHFVQQPSAGKRQWSGIAEAQQQLRLFASVREEFALQLLTQDGNFAGLVEIGVGNALLREAQQETLQTAACCHPVVNMVAGLVINARWDDTEIFLRSALFCVSALSMSLTIGSLSQRGRLGAPRAA